MKIKELILPFGFALLTTWLIQYLFFTTSVDNTITQVADRSFVAPSSMLVAEPLDLEIDFSDAQASRPAEITTVTTGNMLLEFANNGAIIQRMAYRRMLAGKDSLIETVRPAASHDQGAFLVALNGLGSTPYYYKLIENRQTENITYVTYKGESDKAVIIKQFQIYSDSYKIDVKLTVEPKENQEVRARLFFPAPLTTGLVSETISAVFANEKKAIETKALKAIGQFGKEYPSIFGLQDHYFINVLIKDSQQFAQRAYYKLEGVEFAQAVLQAQAVRKPTTWEMTFYCGPKELNELMRVDSRLEGVLGYGWFTPLSKLLLHVLNYFYSIFKNYGVAIIAVTVVIRLFLSLFSLGDGNSKRKKLDAQKKLQYIEQKYKNDPEALKREKAEFARKHGIPGTLGCLALILQIPLFIALQRVLANAIELYKAPFFGWIQDLSAPDPYYVLPVLVGLGVVLHQSVMQTFDPRQSVSNILIAIIIAAVTANISAGLALYIAVSGLLAVAQSYIQKVLKA